MIQIRHRTSGATLLRIDRDTLVGADLSGKQAPLSDLASLDLSNAMMRAVDLGFSHGRGLVAAGADLSNADLSGAEWPDADLSRTLLYSTRMAGFILAGGSLRDARGRNVSFHLANLERVDGSGADLRGSEFLYASLAGSRWIGGNLAGSVFRGANWGGAADLTGCDLSGASLIRCNLRGATLRYCDLSSAVFSSVDLAEVDLAGAILQGTVFAGCRNLTQALGLAELSHAAPSTIDLATLKEGLGALPESFLAGIGLGEMEVAALRAAWSGAR